MAAAIAIPRPDRLTLAAFVTMIVVGGLNFVAVRVTVAELPPYFGAGARMAAGALIFLALIPLLRVPLPRGGALAGTLVFGLLGFGIGYALAYRAMVEISAGLAALLMSLVPLLTVFFATVHGLERLQRRAIAGGLLAVAGVAVVFADRFSAVAAPLAMAAMLGAAATASEAAIIAKRFPKAHPVAMNGIGMAGGAAALAVAAVIAGEEPVLPTVGATWIAYAYLVLVGTVGLFSLYLFTLRRWTATGTAYGFVLTPLVAVPVGAALAGEAVGLPFVIGLALVILGVMVGAFGVPLRLPGIREQVIVVPGLGRLRRTDVTSAALCAEDSPFPKCA